MGIPKDGIKRIATLGMLIGFGITIFWGILSFLLFTLPEGPLAELFWTLVYVTCPPWAIESSSLVVTIATPFLNALLYAVVAVLGAGLLKLRRWRAVSEQGKS